MLVYWRVDFVWTSRFHTSYVRKAIARIETTTIRDLVLEVVFRAKYVKVKVGIMSTKVRGKNIKSHWNHHQVLIWLKIITFLMVQKSRKQVESWKCFSFTGFHSTSKWCRISSMNSISQVADDSSINSLKIFHKPSKSLECLATLYRCFFFRILNYLVSGSHVTSSVTRMNILIGALILFFSPKLLS